MAYVFNLWNFYQAAERVCEFDITPADLPRIKDGTDEFIRSCLNAFGVTNEPTEWIITPFRSYYHSEYIGCDRPWEGRWDIGWTVRVILRQALTNHANILVDLPVDLDARDTTWKFGEEDPRHDTTALVIAVCRGSVNDITNLAMETVNDPLGELGIRSYQSDLFQLRQIFRGVTFPQWVGTGDAIVEKFNRHGGSVNFRELRIHPRF
jgi:hypothetical protein